MERTLRHQSRIAFHETFLKDYFGASEIAAGGSVSG
jgi:hypothetical protein